MTHESALRRYFLPAQCQAEIMTDCVHAYYRVINKNIGNCGVREVEMLGNRFTVASYNCDSHAFLTRNITNFE